LDNDHLRNKNPGNVISDCVEIMEEKLRWGKKEKVKN